MKRWCNSDADDEILCYRNVSVERHICICQSGKHPPSAGVKANAGKEMGQQGWGFLGVTPAAVAKAQPLSLPSCSSTAPCPGLVLLSTVPCRSVTTNRCCFQGHHCPILPCTEDEDGAAFHTVQPPSYPQDPHFHNIPTRQRGGREELPCVDSRAVWCF